MPELPEMEMTRRRIEPALAGKKIEGVIVYSEKLRRLSPRELQTELPGRTVQGVDRRGKYLLIRCTGGTVIVHMGLTGELLIRKKGTPAGSSDHLDILLEGDTILRFHDPRRFGRAAWTTGDPLEHPLLLNLGPEPLERTFDGVYLCKKARGHKVPIKPFIMDGHVVAGVGNMYANEGLFRAGIDPARPAGELEEQECEKLAEGLREAVNSALVEEEKALLNSGGTDEDPEAAVHFNVYRRTGKPCPRCHSPIVTMRQADRSTYYCASCQR